MESDLSLEAHRHLHRLKPEKKDLNPSPFDQKGRPLNQMIGLAIPQGVDFLSIEYFYSVQYSMERNGNF